MPCSTHFAQRRSYMLPKFGSPGSILFSMPSMPGGQIRGQCQVRIAARRNGAVFEMPGPGGANHLRAVVVAVGDEGRRPGESAAARIQPRPQLQSLVAIDGGAGDGAQRPGVVQHAADEMIAGFGTTQAARDPRHRANNPSPVSAVGQVKVDVQPAAGAVAERLGHVRGDRAVFFGDLRRRHFEERDAVGGRQRVVIGEVHLVLAVGVLVVGLIDAPAKLFSALVNSCRYCHRRGHRAKVVAGLGQRIDLVGVPGDDRPVVVAGDEKMLRLHADVEDVALLPRNGQHAFADWCAGNTDAASPSTNRSAANRAVLGIQGSGRVAVQVDAGQHVVRMRPLADSPRPRPGESRADVDHVVETSPPAPS